MGNGPSDGRLPGEYKKLGHVEKYEGREIVVGKLYTHLLSQSHPICCVEIASPELLVVQFQNRDHRRIEGDVEISAFAGELELISSDDVRRRGQEHKDLGEWLVSRANSSDRI